MQVSDRTNTVLEGPKPRITSPINRGTLPWVDRLRAGAGSLPTGPDAGRVDLHHGTPQAKKVKYTHLCQHKFQPSSTSRKRVKF